MNILKLSPRHLLLSAVVSGVLFAALPLSATEPERFFATVRTAANGCKAHFVSPTQKDNHLFSGSDEVAIRVACDALPAGESVFAVTWEGPSGPEASKAETVKLDKPSGRSVIFTLSLQKNGPLSSGFSGSRYSESQLGQWTAYITVNDGYSAVLRFRIVD